LCVQRWDAGWGTSDIGTSLCYACIWGCYDAIQTPKLRADRRKTDILALDGWDDLTQSLLDAIDHWGRRI